MMEKNDILNLKKRYLIWLYKETKEVLDRVDRKFTQIDIDKFIREELRKEELKAPKFFDDFNTYVNNKEKDCETLMSRKGKYLNPENQFLALKLQAIEKSIVKELGAEGLEEIKNLYHQEMVDRILRSTEHK
jgi:hypothetical protein